MYWLPLCQTVLVVEWLGCSVPRFHSLSHMVAALSNVLLHKAVLILLAELYLHIPFFHLCTRKPKLGHLHTSTTEVVVSLSLSRTKRSAKCCAKLKQQPDTRHPPRARSTQFQGKDGVTHPRSTLYMGQHLEGSLMILAPHHPTSNHPGVITSLRPLGRVYGSFAKT